MPLSLQFCASSVPFRKAVVCLHFRCHQENFEHKEHLGERWCIPKLLVSLKFRLRDGLGPLSLTTAWLFVSTMLIRSGLVVLSWMKRNQNLNLCLQFTARVQCLKPVAEKILEALPTSVQPKKRPRLDATQSMDEKHTDDQNQNNSTETSLSLTSNSIPSSCLDISSNPNRQTVFFVCNYAINSKGVSILR